MDTETTAAIDNLSKAQAGVIIAFTALVKALVEEKVVDPNRLIARLEAPLDDLFTSGDFGRAERIPLIALIGFLKNAYASTPPGPTRSH